MLLFICPSRVITPMVQNCFNTSHVTLYHAKEKEAYLKYSRFNTSHVTLYQSLPQTSQSMILVSIHLMLLFILLGEYSTKAKASFNTSHVTLYRPARRGCHRTRLVSIHLMLLFILHQVFCHPQEFLVSIHLMLLFIGMGIILGITPQSFNTSHVTLYLNSGNLARVLRTRFNTSHVTLYRQRDIKQQRGLTFQYISCYSLSLVFPIFSLLTFFIISQNTRVCNIFPKQHRLFESFHRSTPKPYIFTTFHIFL